MKEDLDSFGSLLKDLLESSMHLLNALAQSTEDIDILTDDGLERFRESRVLSQRISIESFHVGTANLSQRCRGMQGGGRTFRRRSRTTSERERR